MIVLREFQVDMIQECRQAIMAGHRAICLVASTGAGKTVIGSKIIQSADDKNKQAMFMAHRRELVKQTAEKLWDFGVQHGIIMAGMPLNQWQGVQIASIDTLRARYMNKKKPNVYMKLPEVAILMIDECHRSLSKTYLTLIEHYKARGTIIIGLTATPIRGDGKGLGHVYDYMVKAPSMAELIQMGYLVEPKYFAPTVPDLTGVPVRRGDYVEGELERVMDRREAVGDIFTNWLRIAPTDQTIVFAAGVKHSIHIAAEFNANGVAAAHIDGTTPTTERDEILAALREREIQVISNCMVLTEGFDCPELTCAVLARPTKHLGLYIQMGGRVLRTFVSEDGVVKDHAKIIDHSGNLYEDGFLEDDHGWMLTEGAACTDAEERQKKLDEKKPITCSQCAHVYTGQLICPKCGHIPVMRGEAPEHRAADLMEIRKNVRDEKAEKEKKKTKNYTHEEKQDWYSQLYAYAQEKGHKEGSVAHKYKAKFGVWPVNMQKVGSEPTPEVLNFITHLNIKRARSKA
jgi:superfamily II DNA or RNA helicase